ncbi:MAG: hypothetical protein JSS54_06760 [Proteobacteria bacterium]|nr:hypothetical protein [Pseudomonadota bacterium]
MADDVSTRFPFINLEKALDRAAQLFSADKSGKPMPVPVAIEVWEYSPKSSGAFQTVGALKQYGLISDDGANEERRIALTERARRYFLDERDDVRATMLADFALSPPLFRALWERDGWSAGVPADTVARSHLKLERNLNDQTSRSLLSIFKENIQFAGLKAGAAQVLEPDVVAPPKSDASNARDAAPAISATPSTSSSIKPIIFDTETITINTRVATREELRSLIEKLERLEPLLPTLDDILRGE